MAEITPPPVPKALVQFNNGFTSSCKEYSTPIKIHFAINNNDKDEVIRLINSGIDLNYSVFGQTPLSVAVFKENYDIACCLVENGACLMKPEKSAQKMLPIHMAAKAGCVPLIQKLLNRSDSCIHHRDAMKFTPLHWSAAMGHKDALMLLIEHSADVNTLDDREKTPLHRAVENEQKEIVECLLNNGADLAIQDFNGWTPLCQSVVCGNAEIVEMLLNHEKVIPNIRDNFGRNCLHLACNPRSEFNLWALCQANLNIASRHLGTTSPAARKVALCYSSQNYVGIASLLLDHGVSIKDKDYKNNSPLMMSLQFSSLEMTTLLINAGSSLYWSGSEEQMLAGKWGVSFSGPPMLKFLSKYYIRKSLGRNVSRKILLLPLPQSLVNYLQLSSDYLDECLSFV